jgi:hypothetical protein
MRLLVDTGGGGGGGWFVLYRAAVTRFGWRIEHCMLDAETLDVVAPFDLPPNRGLPVRNNTHCGPALVIPGEAIDHEDGQLGAGYLPGHIWTFDYPTQKLWLESALWQPGKDVHRVALGFPRNAKGQQQSGFARIPIRVEGETIFLLLDTGATAHPTAAGKATRTEITSTGIGVTSYITTSQLNRWHSAHPDWRVIDHGDDLLTVNGGTRLIEVPAIDVGGWRVGPVWFTERSDANFSDEPGHFASYMDGPISGALGGNVFQHFRMTLDYPAATAWLACVTACHVAPTGNGKH